nr:PREDICTED: cytochrome P450 11B, mitochondrial-like [Apteryx mantelli mantelli]
MDGIVQTLALSFVCPFKGNWEGPSRSRGDTQGHTAKDRDQRTVKARMMRTHGWGWEDQTWGTVSGETGPEGEDEDQRMGKKTHGQGPEHEDRGSGAAPRRPRPFEAIPRSGRNRWLDLYRLWRSSGFQDFHLGMQSNFQRLGPIYSYALYGERLGLLEETPDAESQRFIGAVETMLRTTLPLLFIPPHVMRWLNHRLWRDHIAAWDTIFQHADKCIQNIYQEFCLGLRNFQIETASKEDIRTVFGFILMPEKPPLLTFRPID